MDAPQIPVPSAPVNIVKTGSKYDLGDQPDEGRALCLSGGGYRAMLFHVGTLWRLNEWGLLKDIKRISSVSGGAITAGVLGLNWSRLAFDPAGVGQSFRDQVVDPLRKLAGETIDVGSTLGGMFGPGGAGDRVAKAYRKHLYGEATLQDLPGLVEEPLFIINATNVQSGALWRFSRPFMADYRVGIVHKPKVPLATAVAASSAFPPFLSPLTLKIDANAYAPRSDLPSEDLHFDEFMTTVRLTDGGVYDNLGLETAWKRYKTIWVSDGGGKLKPEEKPKTDWVRHALRVNGLIDNQVRSLRKRLLIESYQRRPSDPSSRTGAYWGIRQDMAKYRAPNTLPCPFDKTIKLADEATRLASLSAQKQERLINWGYAVCDASMRSWFDPALPAPTSFPYAGGVGR